MNNSYMPSTGNNIVRNEIHCQTWCEHEKSMCLCLCLCVLFVQLQIIQFKFKPTNPKSNIRTTKSLVVVRIFVRFRHNQIQHIDNIH